MKGEGGTAVGSVHELLVAIDAVVYAVKRVILQAPQFKTQIIGLLCRIYQSD